MAGFLPRPHTFLPRSQAALRRGLWPRELQRAAVLLGASAALLWSSFAIGRWIVAAPGSGPIYLDLLIAWTAIVVQIAAWPNLWVGLRDLRDRQPLNVDSIVAWRSFLLTLALIFAAIVVLPLQYRSIASNDAWVFVVYLTSFPYQGWMFIPILALHGILFGRVANYLDSRSRRIATAGALVLFAVAAATTAIILQNPGAAAFARSWTVGRGLLPAAALGGYALIAVGITARAASLFPRPRPWASSRRRVRW
ncbi:MAG TPA: hypothetical protein VFA17_11015 [Thermoplasmata archaeon]|jgi:hypothetical protein|nr:hypothetical protein [Thermoplasmata archaeon]